MKEAMGPVLVSLSRNGSHRALSCIWEDVVGPVIARHTRPSRLEHGLLTVTCDGPAWALALAEQQAAVLHKVRLRLGADAVHALSFQAS